VYLETPPDSVRFTYGTHGKPALADPFSASGLRFSVSHANDFAVYAVSWDREVGVDVEVVRPIEDADAIAARFFSPYENRAYLRLSGSDRIAGFFNCWTRKEAFVKALGAGLSYRLDHFDMSLAPQEPARIVRVEDHPGERCGWTVRSFVPRDGLVGAVVQEEPPGRPDRVKTGAVTKPEAVHA
jgi:4'-phosphopantetheinyl transferase